ncbi:DUF4960 domain-containing protein [Salegentibacter sp. Hel_I_6]|uniref:DUF4960 domain-containing protein n=1 Tax=Salegentibacter sp. Hel_I_6 TaxID=1250278 RepID=UPI00056A7CAF|nr:DUF4960 domain-containing protein [Salegentibacter sp. Hel_I_6]
MNSFKKLTKIAIGFVFLLPLVILYSCSDDDNFADVVPDFSEAIIRSFEVDGEFAEINHTTASISMTLPAGTDLSSIQVDLVTPEGTSVSPESGSTVDFSDGPVIFTTQAQNGANREYTAMLAAYGDPKILEFSIGENSGDVDHANNTITIDIGSQDGDITNLTPNFIIPEGTSVDIASGVSRDFSRPVVYTVLSNDGFTANEYTVNVNQIEAPKITSFAIGESEAVIDNEENTIYLALSAGTDITGLSPEIQVPEGQSLSPESGEEFDFTEPVEYTVTNSEGITKTYTVTIEAQDVDPIFYAFLGEQEDIASLIDDDAKAAATWMQNTYGEDFKYISFAEITAQNMAEIKVAMLYYLTPAEDVGYSATPNNVSTLLPSGLRSGATRAQVLKNWVKAGGDMLIAGDATPFIFSLDRVPADFSAPREPGNYVYSEFGCAESSGCVDGGKPADDIWGLGMRPENNSEDRRNHPVFDGLSFQNDEFLALQNSATREVRLIWWQHFDGILEPSCCGQDAALNFEQTMAATKFGTLATVGDAFGYGAILWNRTDQGNHVRFENQIATDFKGSIFSIENTIVGYEWDSNGTTNDYQSNIEDFTKNILAYLYNLED